MANPIHSTGSFSLSLTVVESRGTEMCHAVEPYVSQLCLQTLPGPFDYTLHIVNHTTRASLPEHTVGKAWVTFSEHDVSVKRKKKCTAHETFCSFSLSFSLEIALFGFKAETYRQGTDILPV